MSTTVNTVAMVHSTCTMYITYDNTNILYTYKPDCVTQVDSGTEYGIINSSV